MVFTKLLSTFAIVLSIFSTTALSMAEGDDIDLGKNPQTHAAFVDQNEAEENTPILNVQKNEEDEEGCCPHWGLSHWFSGIGEYIQICFCMPPNKKNGKYEKQHSNYNRIYSDCFFEHRGVCCGDCNVKDNVCAHACSAILCCPWAALTHLCCLPCACCECSPRDPEYVYTTHDPMCCKDSESTSTPPFIPSIPSHSPTKEEIDAGIISQYTVYRNDPPHVYNEKRRVRPRGYVYPDER